MLKSLLLNKRYKKTNCYRELFYESEKFVKGVPRNLDIAVFGSSYARYGFDFDDVGVKGFNFGVYPQPLCYDQVILKHYIHSIRESGYVLLTFPPMVFALDKYNNNITNYKYYPFLKKREIQNYSLKTMLTEAVFPLYKRPDRIDAMKDNVRELINETYWNIDVNLDKSNDGRKEAQERVNGWCQQFALANLRDVDKIGKFDDVFSKNINIVCNMIDLCIEKKINVVLVIPPVSDALLSYFSNEFIQLYLYDNIELIRSRYTDVALLNYLRNNEFGSIDLYSNSDFLNNIGRKLFTNKVITDLHIQR